MCQFTTIGCSNCNIITSSHINHHHVKPFSLHQWQLLFIFSALWLLHDFFWLFGDVFVMKLSHRRSSTGDLICVGANLTGETFGSENKTFEHQLFGRLILQSDFLFTKRWTLFSSLGLTSTDEEIYAPHKLVLTYRTVNSWYLIIIRPISSEK